MNKSFVSFTAVLGALLLAACSGGNSHVSQESSRPGDSSVSMSSNDSANIESVIRVNQLGFLPGSAKLAVVPADVGAVPFQVIDQSTGGSVYSGALSAAANWAPAQARVRIADFSAVTAPGTYRLRVAGLEDSDSFTVAGDIYNALNEAAQKAYYFNRASTELLEKHAGVWARPAGHPDNQVEIHPSAASEARPAGTIVSAPKGWYDAGDYNKYVVNSGISMHGLLAAFEQFPDYYRNQNLNIPESGDAVPDILHEALWNLVWMLDMQDPNDGGVYHKLTTARFEGAEMPHQATEQRYMVAKGTEAALNFAATMAMASRIYADYEEAFPGLSEQMLEAAVFAWAWSQDNPNVRYQQQAMNEQYSPDIVTGEYGGADIPAVRSWAATELYITTGDDAYYTAIDVANTWNTVPAWSNSLGLLWMSLAQHRDNLTDVADRTLIEQRILTVADSELSSWQGSAWRVSMNSTSDFVWGSNSHALNQAMMLIQGYRVSGNGEYLQAAQSALDYVLGRNPTGYSYVTGFGHRPAMDPHHRPSYADTVVDPVPGFLVGGPHNGVQEDCGESFYPSKLPAKSYVDHWCSYSTNEVTINWNAPLVYVTGALQVLLND